MPTTHKPGITPLDGVEPPQLSLEDSVPDPLVEGINPPGRYVELNSVLSAQRLASRLQVDKGRWRNRTPTVACTPVFDLRLPTI